MELSLKALNQIIIMFLIILVGIWCRKKEMIDKNTNKKLSNIVLLIVNPLVIFVSYQMEFNKELLKGLIISMFLAIVSHAISLIVAQIAFSKKQAIEKLSTIYSNCAFMGIPLVAGLFGTEGVFYLTAYITVFNILLWTNGVYLLVGEMDKKQLLKTLISPAIVATVVGFIFFVLKITVKGPIYSAIEYVASMNTPLAMIVAGVSIADIKLLEAIKNVKIYIVSCLKLCLVPIIALICFSFIPLDPVAKGTAVLAAALPTATAVTLLAIKYDKDEKSASEIFATTTLLSALTIPAVMFFVR